MLKYDLNLKIPIVVANSNSQKNPYLYPRSLILHRWVKFHLLYILKLSEPLHFCITNFFDNLTIKMQFCSLKSTFCGIWSRHYWFHKILESINKVISQMFSGVLPCWHKVFCNGFEYNLIYKCLKIATIFPNFQWNLGMSLDVHISRTKSDIDLQNPTYFLNT